MNATGDQQTTRYVVVVHGIGEQRKNETVLPVINRFAEARRADRFAAKPGNPLSLGILSTHLEDGDWIELDGIPREPNEPPGI